MSINPFDDNYFMKQAFLEAEKAFEAGEIPVGAVLVNENQIIARTHNQTELLKDVTAHAEILAITAGEQCFNTKFLENSTLYVTLEPCVMCGGALFWSRIGKVVYGASDAKRGVGQLSQEIYHPKTEVVSGVMESECAELMQRFFKSKRK